MQRGDERLETRGLPRRPAKVHEFPRPINSREGRTEPEEGSRSGSFSRGVSSRRAKEHRLGRSHQSQ